MRSEEVQLEHSFEGEGGKLDRTQPLTTSSKEGRTRGWSSRSRVEEQYSWMEAMVEKEMTFSRHYLNIRRHFSVVDPRSKALAQSALGTPVVVMAVKLWLRVSYNVIKTPWLACGVHHGSGQLPFLKYEGRSGVVIPEAISRLCGLSAR